MKLNRNLYIGGTFVALLFALGVGSILVENQASAEVVQGVEAPMFEVDPFWPKPLPNHWILGSTIGVSVDSRDHVWVIHRQTTFNANTEIGATADPPIAVGLRAYLARRLRRLLLRLEQAEATFREPSGDEAKGSHHE